MVHILVNLTLHQRQECPKLMFHLVAIDSVGGTGLLHVARKGNKQTTKLPLEIIICWCVGQMIETCKETYIYSMAPTCTDYDVTYSSRKTIALTGVGYMLSNILPS